MFSRAILGGIGDKETKLLLDDRIWHRTGDAGYLDASGRLWLLGRCSVRVDDDKGVIYPFSVECVAMTFDFIRRAAFVSHQGRRLLAIELEPGTPDDALTRLKAALNWAAIDDIRVLRRIPVDARHNAKINYAKLHQLITRRGA